ncbi:hypothetical protein N658DRAFT_500074 [Parathielavia hyrcaniae]|uniref:Uncharacterized protein n=1 Tax=Parathielavia hyrcaniae TaxID=113614 RepID=A0AAN6PU10_9PEZI|nr:hypothetical protein N658DRAFT_500074 [Parathielavia hyrcaniae]
MDFVKEAITRMWSADTAAAIDAKLLEKLSYHAAARELACLRPLHEPIKDNDVTNARSFLTRLEVQKTSDNWPEKQRCFRELPDKPYILAAVVCSARVLERKLHIISALCDGLRVAAEWSHWPKDQRLQQLIQHRDRSAVVHNPAIQPALTPSPARAVIESGVPNIGCAVRTAQRSLVQAPSWALTCSSCATKVRLQCACEQTTGKSP